MGQLVEQIIKLFAELCDILFIFGAFPVLAFDANPDLLFQKLFRSQ